MPSIEIVCIQQKIPNFFGEIPFAIEAENEPLSHRNPSLFDDDFKQMQGCVYHLGNPSLRQRSDRCFFAYELLSEKCRGQKNSRFLEFNVEFVPFIRCILTDLIKSSPLGQIVFTTDWQFGPKQTKPFDGVIPKEFWSLHDSHKLKFNSLYRISEDHLRLGVSAVK
jgi:hypothetical protein